MEFHVIKENDLFYLSDLDGQLPERDKNVDGFGLFMQDTRVLSEWIWKAYPQNLRRIGSDSSKNFRASFWYSNTALCGDDGGFVQDQSVLVTRRQFVDGIRFYEECTFENFSDESLTFDFQYVASADYADMFDVRGYTNETVSRTIHTEQHGTCITFSYVAADKTRCQTAITLDAADDVQLTVDKESIRGTLSVRVTMPPFSMRKTVASVMPTITPPDVKVAEGRDANCHEESANLEISNEPKIENVLNTVRKQTESIEMSYRDWFSRAPHVTGEEAFERWYSRGLRDLRMLMTDIGYGTFPVAGVPWYSVPFGRDSLITALQSLSVHPDVARGTLTTMAAFQGTEMNPSRDEQPGKIMHELRAGELTRIGLKPFGPYYGTIDATPLFLNLAADYLSWTGDIEFIRTLCPHVTNAFSWIEDFGDRDGDGFVEYQREAEGGIANQGWKDSGDSVMYRNGDLATGSIALCEVQGYVYRAYQKWSEVYKILGDVDLSQVYSEKAMALQSRFVQEFWMPEERSVALALDGNKRRVEPATSNMGQVLWSGILPEELAHQLINRLLEDDMDSGFGIRTLSTKEKRYNPISYHNGSVWPHDNSIIIAGMALYGRNDAVGQITEGLMKASEGVALWRLPELYGGLSADSVQAPVPYPVSCSPQAWAAATPLIVLQSILNLQPDVPNRKVSIQPQLPRRITHLSVTGIPIGDGHLSIDLTQLDGRTNTVVTANTTGLELNLVPFKEVDRVSR